MYSTITHATILQRHREDAQRRFRIFFQENVSYSEDGLEALVYTAQGDMRQAIGNLQSTHVGFAHVNGKNVFKVCDEPHPLIIKEMIELCAKVSMIGTLPCTGIRLGSVSVFIPRSLVPAS